VIAYKALRAGAVSPFTGFHWYVGEWVEAAASPCVSGVHACRLRDLPYWLGPELWQLELDGEAIATEYKLVAERARLVRRVERWDRAAYGALAEDCSRRILALAAAHPDDARLRRIAGDGETLLARGSFPLLPFFAAVAAEQAGGLSARRAERLRQADWLAEHVLA
jgi:hypothetical protein